MPALVSSKSVWSEQFGIAAALLNDQQMEACMSALQTLVDDRRLPRFWRIRAYVMLAQATDSYETAEDYQYMAETLWHATCKCWPAEQDGELDQLLANTRALLDELEVELDEAMPDELRAWRERAESDKIDQVRDSDSDSSDDDDGWSEIGSEDGEGSEEEANAEKSHLLDCASE